MGFNSFNNRRGHGGLFCFCIGMVVSSNVLFYAYDGKLFNLIGNRYSTPYTSFYFNNVWGKRTSYPVSIKGSTVSLLACNYALKPSCLKRNKGENPGIYMRGV